MQPLISNFCTEAMTSTNLQAGHLWWPLTDVKYCFLIGPGFSSKSVQILVLQGCVQKKCAREPFTKYCSSCIYRWWMIWDLHHPPPPPPPTHTHTHTHTLNRCWHCWRPWDWNNTTIPSKKRKSVEKFCQNAMKKCWQVTLGSSPNCIG